MIAKTVQKVVKMNPMGMNGMNVEVDPNEDTEWNDILRAHGVIPERPPSPSAQLEEALEESVAKAHANRLEDKTLDELDALEDEEDEAFLESYKLKRMAEIQSLASKEKFGSVQTITKQEYTDEVTNASKNDIYVFLHIMYNGVTQSKLLSGLFQRAAEKFRDIKFVQIDARQINENYASTSCPTILIYHNTNVVKQLVTLTQIGGNNTTVKDFEELLIDVGAVKDSDRRLSKNSEDDFRPTYSSIRTSNLNRNDSDDDDFYD